jgi:hypothetical protein
LLNAPPYFDLDLNYEIKWHQNYIKKLHKHKKKPILFHKERGHKSIDKKKVDHHNEWVIESIPFHKGFIKDHEKKLKEILNMVPKRKYKKINKISLEHGGTPEYFVYHKESETFFFVALHSNHKRNYWIHLVRDHHKICDVIVMEPLK